MRRIVLATHFFELWGKLGVRKKKSQKPDLKIQPWMKYLDSQLCAGRILGTPERRQSEMFQAS